MTNENLNSKPIEIGEGDASFGRTPEQMLFDETMSLLDRLKIFSPDLINETITRRIKTRRLEGLSNASLDFLGRPKNLELFVEFGEEERSVGLRNGNKAIVFTLNKADQVCRQQMDKAGVQVQDGIVTDDIPPVDVLVIVERGFF